MDAFFTVELTHLCGYRHSGDMRSLAELSTCQTSSTITFYLILFKCHKVIIRALNLLKY